MKRPRLKKWAKWACTLAAVVCVGLAALSGFYSFGARATSADGLRCWGVGLQQGCLYVTAAQWLGPYGYKPRLQWDWAPSMGWQWGFEKSLRENGWIAGVSIYTVQVSGASARYFTITLLY